MPVLSSRRMVASLSSRRSRTSSRRLVDRLIVKRDDVVLGQEGVGDEYLAAAAVHETPIDWAIAVLPLPGGP